MLCDSKKRGGCSISLTLHFPCFLFQGYWGCAIGKARQAAKTEIEKLQVGCFSFIVLLSGQIFLRYDVTFLDALNT